MATYGIQNLVTTAPGNFEVTGNLKIDGTTDATANPVAITSGGTGQATQQSALDALAGAVTSGRLLRGNGTHVSLAAIQAADVPTLNQNTTGTAANVTGTVARVNGGTGVATTPAAPSTVTHANSGTTASTTLVMGGFGDTWVYTPASSGKTLVIVTGGFDTSTGSAVGGTVGARFGTSTAPNAGDAVTGTRFGGASDPLIRSGVIGTTETPFTFSAVLSLTAATAYWFDLAFDTTNASDPSILLVPEITLVELS